MRRHLFGQATGTGGDPRRGTQIAQAPDRGVGRVLSDFAQDRFGHVVGRERINVTLPQLGRSGQQQRERAAVMVDDELRRETDRLAAVPTVQRWLSGIPKIDGLTSAAIQHAIFQWAEERLPFPFGDSASRVLQSGRERFGEERLQRGRTKCPASRGHRVVRIVGEYVASVLRVEDGANGFNLQSAL